ncbi:PAAR domain-containing protein [Olleya sp. YSTF-M6]|uniref:PAAR domain-containing protein n=1 Tax=Olleya sediminilitoris TaxID=2795739 RepID=A0ABS1WLD3_9FLAO|nr:PAAR domain-containing protein [Olleya sediminilitoris]MBL7559920.1 PAAR domain-containing protein [Olleya sediminilitoris]
MPGPAATIGSMHVCPMLNPGTPPPPHVGGPVVGPGVPTVLIGGKSAAVMGDLCTCIGPPDTIVMGEGTVLIGGKPAATVGSLTAHGGQITQGEPTVLIGTGVSPTTSVMPIHKIPFPTINPTLKVMASITGRRSQLNEAIAQQEALREEAEKNGYLSLLDFSI